MNKQKNVLHAKNLTKVFTIGPAEVTVLNLLELKVKAGESISIMGASGSGKSTLLHLLGGLDLPTQGSVIIQEQDITNLSEQQRSHLRNKTLGFIYQFHHLLPEFTAVENIAMPLLLRQEKPQKAKKEALKLLEKMGLLDRQKHKLAELSGGERQRIAIARALVTKPVCVLADEPTGNLDEKTANIIFQTMLDLKKEMNTSLIIVTHDKNLAAKMDRQLILEHGVLTAV